MAIKSKITAIVILLAVPVAVCLLTTEKIDVTEYHSSIDYGPLNAEQRDVMDAILACSVSGATVIEQNLTQNELDEVLDCIGLHFGSCLAHWNVALWRPGYAEVKPELLRKLEQDKATLDAQIDSALSNMYEGTDRFKLWQISCYLSRAVSYSPSMGDIEPLSGLDGSGSCLTYSMLFYKMAARLDIPVYICYGDVNNGLRTARHAWNMVELDGAQYFYDVTWYDTPLRLPWYLHSAAAWERQFTTFHLISKGGIENGN